MLRPHDQPKAVTCRRSRSRLAIALAATAWAALSGMPCVGAANPGLRLPAASTAEQVDHPQVASDQVASNPFGSEQIGKGTPTRLPSPSDQVVQVPTSMAIAPARLATTRLAPAPARVAQLPAPERLPLPPRVAAPPETTSPATQGTPPTGVPAAGMSPTNPAAANAPAPANPAPAASSHVAMRRRLQDAERQQAEAFLAQQLNDFSPIPSSLPAWAHDHQEEQRVYDDKFPVPVQRPLLELGRDFYGSGIRPYSETWLGETNLVHQQLYVYGDFRTGVAGGRNAGGRIDNWASRLNLDIDYRITSTERFHMFVGPLNKAANNTNVALVDGDLEYNEFYNLIPVTGFFEGDLGAIAGGLRGTSSPREMPVAIGLVPLQYQNGIWMEDAATGFAFAIPAQHSKLLNWANYDASFFAIFDQLNSAAFDGDEHAAQAFGTAWFIDAYDGYIEGGYAYLHDRKDLGRSYHNATLSFTRRYLDRISNSVRVITNSGQELAKDQRTADGALLLIENSLITSRPMNVIPYWNMFAGFGNPQSVARAGVSGGVLRSTGLNFEPDGLNGHPTLDTGGADAYGGAVGIDLIGDNFDRQLILEAAMVSPHGDRAAVNSDQYGIGARYQWAMTHNVIIRLDGMYGWQRGSEDLYGTRIEYRWKF